MSTVSNLKILDCQSKFNDFEKEKKTFYFGSFVRSQSADQPPTYVISVGGDVDQSYSAHDVYERFPNSNIQMRFNDR
ncbi:hypothetical protein F2P81_010146 [Scophthalmus maximus]|uniref:Uncharacterized protein n=1 Tax=Scophthalmus maximus TaxID=52904 RepID=A0A6A4T511_SCOMX|nr:hypothetical protein F2P81_010146 [Scophthalmus maximus]